MFWKMIRWGGTLMVMLLVIAATMLTRQPEETGQPLESVVQQNLNFNF